MNRDDFLDKWLHEKPMYLAWGRFVVAEVCSMIESTGYNTGSYLKQPCEPRVKDDNALIDKAYFHPSKIYDDPYNDIEDKVGCRFVVLLIEQIEEITRYIQTNENWVFKECRHFNDEREKDPLLFTYQSVHYVVRASKDINVNGQTIKVDTPCEIQIRTLLQHAYAELTHDAIYKAKRDVHPEVHRTVAKSMALIETTDGFFSEVNNSLSGSVEDFNVIEILDGYYQSYIGHKPLSMQKSSLVILDTFEDLFKDKFSKKIENFLTKNKHITELITLLAKNNQFYQQSISIFTCWLILTRRNRLSRDWPLELSIVEQLAEKLGVSLDR